MAELKLTYQSDHGTAPASKAVEVEWWDNLYNGERFYRLDLALEEEGYDPAEFPYAFIYDADGVYYAVASERAVEANPSLELYIRVGHPYVHFEFDGDYWVVYYEDESNNVPFEDMLEGFTNEGLFWSSHDIGYIEPPSPMNPSGVEIDIIRGSDPVPVYEPYELTESDLPTLTTDGYTFNGWTSNGTAVSVGDTIEADTVLTAVWEEVAQLEPYTPISISYVTEHGVAPDMQYDNVTSASIWYWPNEAMYTTHPQVISKGLNCDQFFNEYSPDDPYDNSPAILAKNVSTERICWLVFDFEDVIDRNIAFWDNGNDTCKIYTPQTTIQFNYSACQYDDICNFDTPPAFDDIVARMPPVTQTAGNSEDYYYLCDDGDQIVGVKNGGDDKTSWFVLWAGDMIINRHEFLRNVTTPEQQSPYCYFLVNSNLPTLTAEGFDFKGWYLNGQLAECNTPIFGDVTLTAAWEEASTEPDEDEPSSGKKFLLYQLMGYLVGRAVARMRGK